MLDDLDQLDDEILDDQTDDRDDAGDDKPRSIRDSVESAWEKHGGELTEERKDARERRREERDERREKDKPRERGDREKAVSPADRSPKSGSQDGAPAPEQRDAPAASMQPPNGWSPEAKAIWAKLPPAVQAAVTKRETDMTAGARQLQERYGGIHRMITSELAPFSQKYNLPPAQVMANAVTWLQAIERDPINGLRQLAQLYKVDASKLGAAAPAPAPGAPNGVTPQARPNADPRIDHLVRWATTMEQTRRNEVQEAKLVSWSPNKPHFGEVRALMGDLLENAVRSQDPRFLNDAGTDVDLDKLYQAACQVHPEVGPQIIREQAEQERRQQQGRLNQKRRAGSSMRPGTPGSAPLKGEQPKQLKKGSSVRAHVQAAWDEARSA